MTTTTAPSDQEALDQAARSAAAAQRSSLEAFVAIRCEMPEEAQDHARAAQEHAHAALSLLLAMGGRIPDAHPAQDALPLALLRTEATEQLVEALGRALDAAKAVDIERGWVDEEGRPIGASEVIAAHYLHWRREVYGPTGSGRE